MKSRPTLLCEAAAFRSKIANPKEPHKQAMKALSAVKVNLHSQNVILNSVLDALDYPFYVIDVQDYTIKLANSAANFGPLFKDSTCYALTYNRDAPCSGAGHICPLEKIKKTQKPITVEHIHYDKDGNQRFYEVHGCPLFDRQGNVTHVIGYNIDITERKRAEEALRESEMKFHNLVELLPEIVFETDLNGNLTFANRVAFERFGYSVEDFEKGINLEQILVPEDRERALKAVKKIIQGETLGANEYKALRKDGSTFDIIIHSAPIIRKGKTVGLRGVIIDFTERKQADDAIKHKLALEETVTNISGRFVGFFNLDEAINASLSDIGRLSNASRVYVFYLRDGGDAMDNTHEWCAEGVSPQIDNLKKLLCNTLPWWMAKLRKGETIHIENVSAMPEEAGAEKEILKSQDIKSLLVLPLHVGGELAGFIGFDNVSEVRPWDADDLSLLRMIGQIFGNAFERKQAEAQNYTYQQRLKSLVTELVRAEEQEQKRIADLLHDSFGQSLAFIKVKLDVLAQSDSSTTDTHTLREISNSLKELMGQIHDLSFELNSPVLYTHGLDVALKEWLAEEIEQKHGIAVRFEQDESFQPLTEHIRALLFRTTRELLINVVKHAEANHAMVSIKYRENGVEIGVRDDGIGFDANRTEALKGYGLFRIRERLTSIGGHIVITSEPGQGTQVMLRVPLDENQLLQRIEDVHQNTSG